MHFSVIKFNNLKGKNDKNPIKKMLHTNVVFFLNNFRGVLTEREVGVGLRGGQQRAMGWSNTGRC